MNPPAPASEGRQPPSTPEGRALRDARLLAGLTVEEAADKAGMKRGQFGNMERGRQGGRPGPYHAEAALVARAAAALGVTAEQMEAAGRPDAAGILRSGAPAAVAARPALTVVPDELTDTVIDDLIAAVPEKHHRDVLWWRWRETDAENNLKPREERLRALADWMKNYMPKPEGAAGPVAQENAPRNVV